MTIYIEKKVRGAPESTWKIVERFRKGNRTTAIAKKRAEELRMGERPECKHVYRLRCKNGHIKFPPICKWYPLEWRREMIELCKSFKN